MTDKTNIEETKADPLCFADLQFKPHPSLHVSGVQAGVIYPNGYGASIVCTDMSYGGEEGLYELAVLKMEDEEDEDGDKCSKICYDTDITNDVLGWLTKEEVTETLVKIHALKA